MPFASSGGENASGIVSYGIVSFGIASRGNVSLGIVSFGIVSLGIVSFGCCFHWFLLYPAFFCGVVYLLGARVRWDCLLWGVQCGIAFGIVSVSPCCLLRSFLSKATDISALSPLDLQSLLHALIRLVS